MITVPNAPANLLEFASPDAFVPADDLKQFVADAILDEAGPLHNPDHVHLTAATIGIVWTNIPNKRRGRPVAGTAAMPANLAGMIPNKWIAKIVEINLIDWFGSVPDFYITIDANLWNEAGSASRLALLDHELYHCGQAKDEFGYPKFTKDGYPKFALVGHDVEQFSGVVKRYGTAALGPDFAKLIASAKARPTFPADEIQLICGRC